MKKSVSEERAERILNGQSSRTERGNDYTKILKPRITAHLTDEDWQKLIDCNYVDPTKFTKKSYEEFLVRNQDLIFGDRIPKFNT